MQAITPSSVDNSIARILSTHMGSASTVKYDWNVLMREMAEYTPKLSPDKQAELKAIAREQYTVRLEQVQQSYSTAIAGLRSQVYNAVKGYQPTDELSTLNRRDASRRARLLSSPEQAEQLLTDALFLQDDTLAHAIGHRAHAQGWKHVVQAYSHTYGQSAMALQALSVVDNLPRDQNTNLLTSIMFSPSYFA